MTEEMESKTYQDGTTTVTKYFRENGDVAFLVRRSPGDYVEIFRADYRKTSRYGLVKRARAIQIPVFYSVFFYRGPLDILATDIEQAFKSYPGKGALCLTTTRPA